MTYIKKIVMQGFKSFAKRTEIIFDKGINCVIGPNGAGKSNVSDALCFALGRLSIKSIRAAKAANLLFMGTKLIKPSKEAYVEIVFDNESKTFPLPTSEVSLSRIVKHNGQSIYKVNNETKTRGEVIEMLAQAGIDPHGFNLILQGQIQSVVKMHPEDRRKILEEVSGISIYESRKQKSLHELEKTEERLKEISSVLREKTAYLRNLEKERSQALKYKDLEKAIERCKFSILKKRISEKEKEIESIRKSIEEKMKLKEKTKTKTEGIQKAIDSLSEETNKINNYIKRSTGVERESLQEKISDLRAGLEGHKVRKESSERRKEEIEKRIAQMKLSIPEYKREISELQKESPKMAKKQDEIKRKKGELAKLDEERNKVHTIKSELANLRERIREKESRHVKLNYESDAVLKQIEALSAHLTCKDEPECVRLISKLDKDRSHMESDLEGIKRLDFEILKKASVGESQISSAEELKQRVSQIDICPVCTNKMTKEHVSHVVSDSNEKISKAKALIKEAEKILNSNKEKIKKIQAKLKENADKSDNLQGELSNHRIVKEKHEYLKKLVEETNFIEKELSELKLRRDNFENRSIDASLINEQYSSKLREIEEISSRNAESLDITLMSKERELERINQVIAQNEEDLGEITAAIQDLTDSLGEKSALLESKEQEEQELSKKFKKMFDDRERLQAKIQEESYNLSNISTESAQIDEQINYLKIGFAKIDAEKRAVQMDLSDVKESEPIPGSIEALEERMEKTKTDLHSIGAINMRALEVYEGVKEEYEKVAEKVTILENEKLEIMKIIEEIDNKKKKTFTKTFKSVNDLFSRNFSQLYTKGQAYLEIENPEDLFAGGINIAIKMGKGKYFDVSSLSGGEQTLIALSLLFAIQEHKPYHFYIFDEIDAALDKRNSERLASLLNKFMTSGQYIIVTHNDAIITNSDFLYGVSMHDGVSKVFSLKLDDKMPITKDQSEVSLGANQPS